MMCGVWVFEEGLELFCGFSDCVYIEWSSMTRCLLEGEGFRGWAVDAFCCASW
jgi:hypothetical protein